MRIPMSLAVGVTSIAVLAGCSGPAGDPADAPAAAPVAQPTQSSGRVTAVMVTPAHDAQVVLGDDGMEHIEYELIVVNVFADPVTLTEVDVLDPSGKRLLRLSGDQLETATQTLLAKTPSAVVPASAAVGIDVDVALPPGTVPATVTHRIDYSVEPGTAAAALVPERAIDGPEVAIDRAPALRIAAPVQGDSWLVTSACCSPNAHRSLRLAIDGRRIETPETFAVDLAQIKGNRVYKGSGSTNEQFHTLGADVFAVADGTVVAAVNEQPDQDPTKAMVPRNITEYGGNQVLLEIAPGVFAWYGHLKQGSVTVTTGDTVTTGMRLGKVGNSGPSGGPHLHFGLVDNRNPIIGRSLPFVLDSYTLAGTVDWETSTGDRLAIERKSQQITDAYPLYGNILNLP